MPKRFIEIQAWASPLGTALGLPSDPPLGSLLGADVPSGVVTEAWPDSGPGVTLAEERNLDPDRLRLGIIEMCVIINALPPDAVDVIGRDTAG